MITDIIMAFLMAMLMNMGNKYLKQIMIFVCCITIIITYFINNFQINFIGEIDFGIWLIFIIMFDITLTFTGKRIKKHIKE